VEEFRNSVYPGFVPPELWQIQNFEDKPEKGEPPEAWKQIQRLLRDVWSKGFPLDGSVQLITSIATFSRHGALLRAALADEEVDGQAPAPVWPFQRAVMFFAVNSWRARFCPRCGKRFVAATPKSTYCSDACFQVARKDSKKLWWNAHGQAWRDSRTKTKSKGRK